MKDLESQIVSNVANDHGKRLLKSTLCRLRQKGKQNKGGCVRNKDKKRSREKLLQGNSILKFEK